MDNEEKKQKATEGDIRLHDILIKQYGLMMQQFEYIKNLQEKQKEQEDEIDLRKLVPGFLRKKKKSITSSPETVVAYDENTPMSKQQRRSGKDFIGKQGFGWFRHSIIASFQYLLLTFKRFVFLIGIFLVLALGYGIYIYLYADKEYESSMILDSGNLKNDFYEGIIDNLQFLIATKSYVGLAKKIDISLSEAKIITNIRYSDYEDYKIPVPDETGEYYYPFFKITVRVKDNVILPNLEKALFNYMVSNPYVKNTKEVKKTMLEESIGRLSSSINGVDSLKMAVIKRISRANQQDDKYFVKETGIGGGGIILSQEEKLEIDPMIPFEKALTLEKEQLDQKQRLLNLEQNDFKIINGFSIVERPAFPRFIHIVLMSLFGLAGGVIISLMIMILIDFFKWFIKFSSKI